MADAGKPSSLRMLQSLREIIQQEKMLMRRLEVLKRDLRLQRSQFCLASSMDDFMNISPGSMSMIDFFRNIDHMRECLNAKERDLDDISRRKQNQIRLLCSYQMIEITSAHQIGALLAIKAAGWNGQVSIADGLADQDKRVLQSVLQAKEFRVIN